MYETFIYDALRTPRGKGRAARKDTPGGSLASVAPHQLVAGLVEGLRSRTREFETNLGSLTLGCVGQIGPQGGHLALVSRLAAKLPHTVIVQTLNNYCVSGLTAVKNAAQTANDKQLHLAGGVESLSQVGFLADKASYYNDQSLVQSLRWAPPIMGAELVATIEGFTKPDLDEITLRSHQRATQGWLDGAFDTCVKPVVNETGTILLAQDELIQTDLSLDKLASMQPAFAEQGASGFDDMMLREYRHLTSINHTHSIANCPGLADGAALILLGSQKAGQKIGIQPKAKIISSNESAGDPILQFSGGFAAMEKALLAANLSIDDFDRIEFMESFAAIPLKFLRDYNPDLDKVNVNGGHLAMGHPLGATGAILLTQLVHELERCDGELGLVVASAGGGIGAAMIIQRTD